MTRNTETLEQWLIKVIEKGDVEECRAAIKAGADVNCKDDWSALHYACGKGSAEIVAMLIEAKADLRGGNWNWSPLMVACEHGHLAVCKQMVAAGADVGVTGYAGETALSLASESGHYDVCSLVLDKHADVDSVVIKGRSALMHAAREGDVALLQLLLDRGADIEQQNAHRWTPLLVAASENRVEACRALLERGADPARAAAPTAFPPLTAFQMAVKSGAAAVVEYFLVERGEEPAQRTQGRCSMVQLAGKSEIVKNILRSAKTTGLVASAATDPVVEGGPAAAPRDCGVGSSAL
jgi:ankyrin repeat protein